MELTPSSIVAFFKEAQILHDLQHENVVEVKGIVELFTNNEHM